MSAIELMAKAYRDAALADALHKDHAFRQKLQQGDDVARLFEVTSAASSGSDRRSVQRSWKLRLRPDQLRSRPVL